MAAKRCLPISAAPPPAAAGHSALGGPADRGAGLLHALFRRGDRRGMCGCSPAPPLPVHRQPPPSRVRVHDRAGHDPLRPVAADAGRDRGGRSVSVLANPRLDNNVYPRGMLVYDCTAPEGCLRLPFYPFKLRHACVAAVEGISPDMVDNALNRLRQETRRGSCSPRTADALERFCREVLLSDRVQRCGTLREQTTVINAMLTAVLHRPRAAVPLDADGDAHRPPAGNGSSDGRRAHLPNAVPAGAARIASAGAGRRFRLLDGNTSGTHFSGDSTARRCFLRLREARARRRWRVKTRWERL